MSRVIVTMNLPEDYDTHELATDLEASWPESDPTVWTFEQFFNDLEDGVIGRSHDDTITEQGDK